MKRAPVSWMCERFGYLDQMGTLNESYAILFCWHDRRKFLQCSILPMVQNGEEVSSILTEPAPPAFDTHGFEPSEGSIDILNQAFEILGYNRRTHLKSRLRNLLVRLGLIEGGMALAAL